MTTDHGTPAAPVDALEPEPRPHHTDPAIGASEPQDEAALREWDGLAPDTAILTPTLAPASPMRLPEQVWAMLVVAVDIVDGTDPHRAGVRQPHRCHHRLGRPPPERLERMAAQLGRAHVVRAPERTPGAARAVNPMRDPDAVKGTHDHLKTGRHMVYIAADPVNGTEVRVGDPDEHSEVGWYPWAMAEGMLPHLFEPVANHLRATLSG